MFLKIRYQEHYHAVIGVFEIKLGSFNSKAQFTPVPPRAIPDWRGDE
jgi:hypothetical protein